MMGIGWIKQYLSISFNNYTFMMLKVKECHEHSKTREPSPSAARTPLLPKAVKQFEI
jgi:hypothetical protein